MNEAHIICPGPSLPSTYTGKHRIDPAVRIAVNRGLNFLPDSDWLVCGDRETFSQLSLFDLQKGIVGLNSDRDVIDKDPCALALSWIGWHDLPGFVVGEINWGIQVALLTAAHLGCKIVHVFGCDQVGDEEYNGPNKLSTRTPERWERERADTMRTVAAIGTRGTYVCFHLPCVAPIERMYVLK